MKGTAYNSSGRKVICMVPPKYDEPIDNFTPAEQGIICATIEAARDAGMGDDETVDFLAASLRTEDIRLMRGTSYEDTAYYLIHG